MSSCLLEKRGSKNASSHFLSVLHTGGNCFKTLVRILVNKIRRYLMIGLWQRRSAVHGLPAVIKGGFEYPSSCNLYFRVPGPVVFGSSGEQTKTATNIRALPNTRAITRHTNQQHNETASHVKYNFGCLCNPTTENKNFQSYL